VLSVEDWAEIRRLRRAEKMSISEIALVERFLRTRSARLHRLGSPLVIERPRRSSRSRGSRGRPRHQRRAFNSVITYLNSWGGGWGDAGRFGMRLRTYEAG
jgi:hypothetical protein